jgi:transposase
LLFEAFAMSLIECEMPVNKVARTLRVQAHRLWRVFDHYIEKAVSEDRLDEVKEIGIDETSSRKGHRYVTVVADLQTKRAIPVVEGKDVAAMRDFKDALESKGGSASKIKWISMDMSPAFISGHARYFHEAHIVFDKFHLMQIVNAAIDQTRKQERKGNELLKGHKYTVLRNYRDLSQAKKQQLHQLLSVFPTLGEAYRLRETLNEIWQIEDPQVAQAYLSTWCDYALETNVIAFRKVVKTFRGHWSGIVTYFHHRTTNAVLENINGKIQSAKRRARGYRNIKNFINHEYVPNSVESL